MLNSWWSRGARTYEFDCDFCHKRIGKQFFRKRKFMEVVEEFGLIRHGCMTFCCQEHLERHRTEVFPKNTIVYETWEQIEEEFQEYLKNGKVE